MTDGVTGWPPGVGTDVVGVTVAWGAVAKLADPDVAGVGAVARTTEPTSTTAVLGGT